MYVNSFEGCSKETLRKYYVALREPLNSGENIPDYFPLKEDFRDEKYLKLVCEMISSTSNIAAEPVTKDGEAMIKFEKVSKQSALADKYSFSVLRENAHALIKFVGPENVVYLNIRLATKELDRLAKACNLHAKLVGDYPDAGETKIYTDGSFSLIYFERGLFLALSTGIHASEHRVNCAEKQVAIEFLQNLESVLQVYLQLFD